MSRATTPAKNTTAATPTTQTPQVPHEKIAMRYDKWCKQGMPHGMDHQNWIEAEKELKSEITAKPAGKR